MVDGDVASDCKTAAHVAIDTVKCKAAPTEVSEKVGTLELPWEFLLVIGIDVGALTLLTYIHGKVDTFAQISAACCSIENILPNVHNVAPKTSFSELLGLLIPDRLAEVDIIRACHIRPRRRLCGQVCGESYCVLSDLGDKVRLSLVIRPAASMVGYE